jgi:3-oxoacyl-ACP reductase-like protein
LQNEILGDLQQEFAPALKKDQELPFEELGSALGSGFNRSLGKYLLGSRQLTALSHQNALLEEQLEGLKPSVQGKSSI